MKTFYTNFCPSLSRLVSISRCIDQLSHKFMDILNGIFFRLKKLYYKHIIGVDSSRCFCSGITPTLFMIFDETADDR